VFDSVAELRGVQRASEECHVSQPAVTQAIAKLEEQIGVALLQRGARGTYVNDFGVIFHRRTQRFLCPARSGDVGTGRPGFSCPLPRVASRITRAQIRTLISIVEKRIFRGRGARARSASGVAAAGHA